MYHLQVLYITPFSFQCYTAITCVSTSSAKHLRGYIYAAEADAEVTASSELEHVDNGEEVELEVTAKLVESFNSIRIL